MRYDLPKKIILDFEKDHCNDCPFYAQEPHYCKAACNNHPMGLGGELHGTNVSETRPKWCPLEVSGFITVCFGK